MLVRMGAVSVGAVTVAALLVGSHPASAADAGYSAAGAVGVQTAVPLPNPEGLGYHEYLPPNYDKARRWPLVVFFHGIGERGDGKDDLSRVTKHGPPKLLGKGGKLDGRLRAIVVSPQTSSNWGPEITSEFVAKIRQKYPVDPDRVYITGLSLGGEGAWRYAVANRDKVAAIVPVCGADASAPEYKNLTGLPTWAYHNVGDSVVNADKTRDKLALITGVDPEANRPRSDKWHTGGFDPASGTWNWRPGLAAPRATERVIYSARDVDNGNHDAWTDAYANPQLWSWLFRQRRSR